MGSYGITALSGLSGALDRQDRRNDMLSEIGSKNPGRCSGHSLKNQQEDRAAGAENNPGEIALEVKLK